MWQKSSRVIQLLGRWAKFWEACMKSDINLGWGCGDGGRYLLCLQSTLPSSGDPSSITPELLVHTGPEPLGSIYKASCPQQRHWYHSICLLWLLSQITTNLVAQNDTEVLGLGYGGQESRKGFVELTLRCWQAPFPCGGSGKNPFSCFFLL